MKDKKKLQDYKEENEVLKNQLGKLEHIELSYIDKSGRVRMIKWGKDYNKWDLEKRLDYAEALASSMNDACRLIQDERNKWLVKAKDLERELEQAQIQVNNHLTNNINAITKANSDKQELAKRVLSLENELVTKDKTIEQLNKELHIATLTSE